MEKKDTVPFESCTSQNYHIIISCCQNITSKTHRDAWIKTTKKKKQRKLKMAPFSYTTAYNTTFKYFFFITKKSNLVMWIIWCLFSIHLSWHRLWWILSHNLVIWWRIRRSKGGVSWRRIGWSPCCWIRCASWRRVWHMASRWIWCRRWIRCDSLTN